MSFNFGSPKDCSPAIFETYFSYDKGIWIAATDSYVDILFLLFLASVTLGFWSFQGKVFILCLPNLVWVFIGLIACMGLLLVKIAVELTE